MDAQADPMFDQRAEEEAFLLTVRDSIADDIKFVERGGVPHNWRGCQRAEILGSLRRHHFNVTRAIDHVRGGGPLTDIVPIVWGVK